MQTVEFEISENKRIEVMGHYHPGGPMVKYYRDGSGDPGSDPFFEIEKVMLVIGIVSFEIDDILDQLEKIKVFNWDEFTEVVTKRFEQNEREDSDERRFQNYQDRIKNK